MSAQSREKKSFSLFREEVLRQRAEAIFGGVILPSPRWGKIASAATFGLMAAGVSLLCFATYTKKVSVVGWVESIPGAAKISSPESGLVKELLVSEGQVVSAGQTLLRLTTARTTSSGNVDDDVVSILQSANQIIDEQASRQKQSSENQKEQKLSEISALQQNLLDLKTESDIRSKRLLIATDNRERRLVLGKNGVLSKEILTAAEDEVLAAQIEFNKVQAQIASTTALLNQKKIELTQIGISLNQQISDLSSRRNGLAKDIVVARGAAEVLLVAPIDGEVTGLQVELGQSVDRGQSIMAVLPEGATLYGRLTVPTRAAAFLKVGAPVRLRYDAFPYQKFGQHVGKIRSIGKSVLMPNSFVGPTRLAEPAYLVTVDLPSSTLKAYGEQIDLKNGFSLKSDILIGRLTLIEWLFDALYIRTL